VLDGRSRRHTILSDSKRELHSRGFESSHCILSC
jgi:hypothetical protein